MSFRFRDGCHASKYHDWSFYRNQFQHIAGGCRAVDILCVEGDVSWLIEIKDYRQHRRTKVIDISDELATKVRDTLAGLASAAKAANEFDERRQAQQALEDRRWRVVLHLEQPTMPHRLRPRPIDTANLLMKLRTKTLKAIDAHPLVCDRNTLSRGVPWTVL